MPMINNSYIPTLLKISIFVIRKSFIVDNTTKLSERNFKY